MFVTYPTTKIPTEYESLISQATNTTKNTAGIKTKRAVANAVFHPGPPTISPPKKNL